MIINNARTEKCKAYFLKLILEELKDFDVWVAGGAIRTWFALEDQSDIDLFFKTEKQRRGALELILKNENAKTVFENDNVTKVSYKGKIFDFCRKYYANPEDCIGAFDFTVSMAAVDHDNAYFGPDFFMDLASKRLAFNDTPYPMSSLFRMQKYIKKGYWMCKDEMIKFTAVLQGVDLTQFNGTPEPEEEIESESETNPFPGID